MADTLTPETERDGVAEPAGESTLFLGGGQAAWLALVTLASVLALVLSVVALVVANSDDGGAAAGPAAGAPPVPSTELSVGAREFAFDPSAVAVPAGEEITVTLNNDGAVAHEWVVLSEPITSEADFDESLVLARVGQAEAGQQARGTFTVDSTGNYQVICAIAGHFDAGMSGTLAVS